MGYLEYIGCMNQAKTNKLTELQKCNVRYAAGSWSKLPFGKLGSLAALRLLICVRAVNKAFDAEAEFCKKLHLAPETEPEVYALNLGNNIKALRIKMELSQNDLANCLNQNKQRIMSIEHGTNDLTIPEIEQIAECLHVPVKQLLK